VITRRIVVFLGISQLVCWGISYYLIGVFGPLIAADTGWSGTQVYGGFTAALVVMGLASPLTGRLIDRHGGGRAMVAGSVLLAAGCAGLAVSHTLPAYYGSWICLGVAMRLCLYDAAFAALARLGGRGARRPIAQVTLLGGLASSVFWPVGSLLSEALGWRGALVAYAVIALMTVPLHMAIPAARGGAAPDTANAGAAPPRAGARRDRILAATLYVTATTLISFLNSGLTAHMIALLAGLGIAASMTVWIASLRGIGQSAARLCEVLFASRLHPLDLNVVATALLAGSIVAGAFSGQVALAAVGFAFFYGAGNGLATITRGTLPLVFFDPRTYGATVGRLLAPSFLVSSAAPMVFAYVIERAGAMGALALAGACAAVVVACAVALKACFSGR
jgi:MFS family permease